MHYASYSIVYVCNRLRFVIRGFLFDIQHRLFLVLLIEKLHTDGNDLAEKFGRTIIIVLIRLQPSFRVNEAAFLQLCLADFPQSSPGFDVDPFDILPGFTGYLPALRYGQAKVRQLLPRRGKSTFGVPA